MGKATRWLKGIFGIKTSTNNNNVERKNERNTRKPKTPPPNHYTNNWVKSYYGESEKEQSMHAIAVAAATAMAADAAVVAAQAAVEVVRLTSHGRGAMFSSGRAGGGGGGGGKGGFCGGEHWAAVQIQTTFRGYLARKALRALKGLVKIQALVRGYLVRKQATATLHGMQALIRAQATVRSKRRTLPSIPPRDFLAYPPHSEFRPRRSLEIYDDTRSEQAASIHSRRLSASFERRSIKPITEDIPKIVEVDPGRPRTPTRPYKNNNNFTPRQGSDPCDPDPSYPPPLSIPSCQHWHDSEWGLTGDECRFSTAHSTPRFMNSSGPMNPGLVTPSKSLCGDTSSYYSYNYNNQTSRNLNLNQNQANQGHPNYMANTQSFRGKVRSQSAPKTRPAEKGQNGKRLSLNEMMESRNSLSGVRMQRSCSQVQGAIHFKNAVMGKLERSYDFSRDPSQVYRLDPN